MPAPTLALAAVIALSLLGCGGDDAPQKAPLAFRETASTASTVPTPPTTTPPVAPTAAAPLVYRPNQWKVGDVVTMKATFKQVESSTVAGTDGNFQPMTPVDQTIATRWIEKVVEVDPEGRRTRYLVHFAEWLRTNPETRDQSLVGVTIAVTGFGGQRAWSYVGEKARDTRTEAAERWLDQRFGPNPVDEEEVRRLMLPTRPVGVGTTWSPDVGTLLVGFRRDGVVIDREKVKITAKLDAIADGFATCSFDGTLPVTRLPGLGDTGTIASRGVAFKVDGRGKFPLEGRLRLEPSIERDIALAGEVKTDGRTVRLDVRLHEALLASEGGDFPATGG